MTEASEEGLGSQWAVVPMMMKDTNFILHKLYESQVYCG
jgi:hypothetical protein